MSESNQFNDLFSQIGSTNNITKHEPMSLASYFEKVVETPDMLKLPHQAMLDAIGEPVMCDTSKDTRLSRIFANKTIRTFPNTFKEFYGMESALQQVYSYFQHAAQGLEERKQILYFLGPVGGGKSSLAENLKALLASSSFFAIEGSPNHDSPLAIIPLIAETKGKKYADQFLEQTGISKRFVPSVPSPWLTKKWHQFLEEKKNPLEELKVIEINRSITSEIGIAKVEPGDENNQDISTLVGKTDIRKLGSKAQNDPEAYSYSGGLNKTNQGMMEFVEMFKAPIKVLHPLLTATQENNYNPVEGMAAMPFQGIIMAHSNESEWQSFRNNKNNEAFLDRVYIIKVPYNLRVSEEIKIYQKLLDNSSLAQQPCAPDTLKMLAQFVILSRLDIPENQSVYSKMRAYDGENLKDIDPKAKSAQEYKDAAGPNEGMSGISTRAAFKILAKVFNFDTDEVAANPVHLLYVLEQFVEQEEFPEEVHDRYMNHIKEHLAKEYVEFIGKEIQTAYLESYSEYGQNIFDRYVTYADFWTQDQDYRDPETGEMLDRTALNEELEKIEKPAGVSNPKDFRSEIVNFVLRSRANNNGNNPSWSAYEKMKNVIEKKMFSNTEDLLPVISFSSKSSAEDEKKHENFVERMVERGYTKKQVRLLSEWYLRVRKSQ